MDNNLVDIVIVLMGYVGKLGYEGHRDIMMSLVDCGTVWNKDFE